VYHVLLFQNLSRNVLLLPARPSFRAENCVLQIGKSLRAISPGCRLHGYSRMKNAAGIASAFNFSPLVEARNFLREVPFSDRALSGDAARVFFFFFFFCLPDLFLRPATSPLFFPPTASPLKKFASPVPGGQNSPPLLTALIFLDKERAPPRAAFLLVVSFSPPEPRSGFSSAQEFFFPTEQDGTISQRFSFPKRRLTLFSFLHYSTFL